MSAIGTWTLTMKTPMGDQTGAFCITQAAEVLSATMTGPDGVLQQVNDLKSSGDKLTWKVAVKKPFPMTMHFEVTIDGNTLTGKFRPGMFPSSPVTGVRT